MFSTVPFSFCHVKSKPLKRDGDILSLTPHAAVLPIKERSTTAANGSQSITKRREEKKVILVIIILIITFVTIALCLPLFLPCGAITTSLWQPCNNQHNHYYHNHHHHHCHCRLCHVCLPRPCCWPASERGITLRGRT